MRTLLTALLLTLALLAAACEGAGDGDAATVTGEDQPAATEDAPADVPATLPEGVAAIVNGAEIPADEVERRMAAVEADEEFAAALEGEEGEQLAAQFRAETLSVLVQTRIVLDGAEELGAIPTEEDVERTRAEIAEDFGGQEEFEEAVETSGMSRQAFEEQLRGVAALEVVGRTLAERGDVPEPPEGAEGIDPEQLAVQQWLGERLAAADVVIDASYGQWNPQAGQIMPAGMGG